MTSNQYAPKELIGSEYWNKPKNEQFRILVDIIYKGLRTYEAWKILKENDASSVDLPDYINILPTKKSVKQDIDHIRSKALGDRPEDSAILLAKASEGYLPPEARERKKPVLDSGRNIAKVMGATSEIESDSIVQRVIKPSYSRHILLALGLSASNPGVTEETKFSYDDIRRGIHIPDKIDSELSALGFIYAYALLRPPPNYIIRFQGKKTNEYVINNIISPVMLESFNILKESKDFTNLENEAFINGELRFFEANTVSHIIYYSRALSTHLKSRYEFTANKQKRKKMRIHKDIRDLEPAKLEIFTKSLLTNTSINARGVSTCWDISKELLRDIDGILDSLGIEGKRKIFDAANSDSHYLSIYERATRDLCNRGLLGLNPYYVPRINEINDAPSNKAIARIHKIWKEV